MSTIEKFEDLVIWQEAKGLTKEIYQSLESLKDYGFKDQIQRAAVSIMNNVAEGFERDSDTEYVRFLFYAKGSAGEVRSMLLLARELNYLDKEKSFSLVEQVRKLSGSIGNFIKYLRS